MRKVTRNCDMSAFFVELFHDVPPLQDSIKTVNYMIAVCRDQSMLDPTAAWTVLELVEHVVGDYI